MTVLMDYYTANPLIMSQLMSGVRVDIGGGLSILFGDLDNPLEYPGHYTGHFGDGLRFSFFLEGEYIGGLDDECGGAIHRYWNDSENDDRLEEDMELHTLITERMTELFNLDL